MFPPPTRTPSNLSRCRLHFDQSFIQRVNFMKNHTPEIIVYGRTFDEVTDVMCRRQLLHCEPVVLYGFLFATDCDQVGVRLGMEGIVMWEGKLIIALPAQRAAAESTIQQLNMGSQVKRLELVGVRFWAPQDQAVFDEEFGFADAS